MLEKIEEIALLGRERKPILQEKDEVAFSTAFDEFWRRHGKGKLMPFSDMVREITALTQTTCGRALSPEFVTMELCEEFWWSKE